MGTRRWRTAINMLCIVEQSSPAADSRRLAVCVGVNALGVQQVLVCETVTVYSRLQLDLRSLI